MEVEFKVNEDYLLKQVLYRRPHGEPNPDIEELLRQSGKDELMILFGNIDQGLISGLSLENLGKKTDEMIARHKQTDEFGRILKATQTHLQEVKAEWDSNFDKTLEWMKRMTGLSLDQTYHVLITHPSVPNGKYLSEIRTIGWCDRGAFPNNSTVYIWHEIMHAEENLRGGDLEHAIIELLTDNELRWFLTEYDDKPLEGHKYLNNLRRGIFCDFWPEYLTLSKKDIKKFVEKVKKEMSD